MTTYLGTADLNLVLDNFVSRYYGTFIDDGEDETTIGQFYDDMNLSFQETNEKLANISHIKTIPVGTQVNGVYPFHVRSLQANLMIYSRLMAKHSGEIGDDVPGWIRVYKSHAREVEGDIRGQNVVFEDDVAQLESGIGQGSYVTHVGSSLMFTNWQTGSYLASDFPRVYSFVIDGTGGGQTIGSSTFKMSRDNGVSYYQATTTTSTNWVGIENGLQVRWEPVGTVTAQLELNDEFKVQCIPTNIPVTGGNIKHTTFRRG